MYKFIFLFLTLSLSASQEGYPPINLEEIQASPLYLKLAAASQQEKNTQLQKSCAQVSALVYAQHDEYTHARPGIMCALLAGASLDFNDYHLRGAVKRALHEGDIPLLELYFPGDIHMGIDVGDHIENYVWSHCRHIRTVHFLTGKHLPLLDGQRKISALHNAVKNECDLPYIRDLLSVYPHLVQEPTGMSVLWKAALTGMEYNTKKKLFKLLIDYGADPYKKVTSESTMHMWRRNRRAECAVLAAPIHEYYYITALRLREQHGPEILKAAREALEKLALVKKEKGKKVINSIPGEIIFKIMEYLGFRGLRSDLVTFDSWHGELPQSFKAAIPPLPEVPQIDQSRKLVRNPCHD